MSGRIKDLVRVIINTVPRLSADVFGNEWPEHPHHMHTELDHDDHLQYMRCTAGPDRPFIGDVWMDDVKLTATANLRFDDHYRVLHTAGGGDWTQLGIDLSSNPSEWQDYFDTFGAGASLLKAMVAGHAEYSEGTGIDITSLTISNTGVLSIVTGAETPAAGAITLTQGANVTIAQVGSTFMISAAAGETCLWQRNTGKLTPDTITDWVGIGNANPGCGFQVGSAVVHMATPTINDTCLSGRLEMDGDVYTDRWLNHSTNTFFGVEVAALGTLAHTTANEGYSNTFYGYRTGRGITTGYWNTLIGSNAGLALTTGYANMFLGYAAGDAATTAYSNAGVGSNALGSIVTGAQNVAVGANALGNASQSNNTAVGYYSGFATTTGLGNVFLGRDAGASNTSGPYNICSGYDIDLPSATISYQLNIGGIIYGKTNTGFVGINRTVPICGLSVGSGDPVTVNTNNDLYVTGKSEFLDSVYVKSLTTNSIPYIGAADVLTEDNAYLAYTVDTCIIKPHSAAGTAALTIETSGATSSDIVFRALNTGVGGTTSLTMGAFSGYAAVGGASTVSLTSSADSNFAELNLAAVSSGTNPAVTPSAVNLTATSNSSASGSSATVIIGAYTNQNVAQVTVESDSYITIQSVYGLTVTTTQGNLDIYSGSTGSGSITVRDEYLDDSDWTAVSCEIAAAVTEWNSYKTAFGEVSIIAAILQASAGGGGVTLDGAYDYGGAGAGRSITADSGAVYIGSSTNTVLDLLQNKAVSAWSDTTDATILMRGSSTNVILGTQNVVLGINRSGEAAILKVISSASDGAYDSTLQLEAVSYGGAAIVSMLADYLDANIDYADWNQAEFRDLRIATYGSAFGSASFASNTVTVNWATGKAYQTVTVDANVTGLTMTAPAGATGGLCIRLVASGGTRTVGGLTGVQWGAGHVLSGAAAASIPSGDWLDIYLVYNGSYYTGTYLQKG